MQPYSFRDKRSNYNLDSSRRKDVRRTYLDQYENQGISTITHQHQKITPFNVLNDITDRHGFEWNEEGKIQKKINKKHPSVQRKSSFNPQSSDQKQSILLDLNKFKHPQLDHHIEEIYSKYTPNKRMSSLMNKFQSPRDQENQNYLEETLPKFGMRTRAPTRSPSVSPVHRQQKMNIREVDKKITLITDKIRETQKRKKVLDINFKPFTIQKLNSEDESQKRTIKVQSLFSEASESKNSFEEVKVEKAQPRYSFGHEKIEPKLGFVRSLCKQIELDNDFKKMRIKFQKDQDPHKWGKLSDLLCNFGKKFKYHELVDIFSIEQQDQTKNASEHEENLIDKLVQAYRKSQNHWQMNLHNRIAENQLSQQQFTIKELDHLGRGCISVDALVRYINGRSEYFFIESDMMLLMRRVTGSDKKQAQYSQFLKVFSE